MPKTERKMTTCTAQGKKRLPQSQGLSPSVVELIAIGASIAANCEPCFKCHFNEARRLKVSKREIAKAVAIGAMVKNAPDQAIKGLAQKHLKGFSIEPDEAPACCCGTDDGKSSTCREN